LYWERVFKREDGKRIKGEHEKPKGEKTKITLADKKQKGTSHCCYSKLKMRELAGF
jgi:hypothetical protein